MSYVSEDIKKMNSEHLLKVLYSLKNATMAELVKESQLSQSSVRSILKELVEKEVLCLQAIDKSSGGRCPGRYTFSSRYLKILSVFIDEGTVDILVKDILEVIYFKEHLVIEMDARLEAKIITVAHEYEVNCVCIASSGVVQEDYFYTDQGEYMQSHEIAVHLKQVLTVPIVIENDVKAMLMGKQPSKDLAYLYMSHSGVGSAFYLQGQIFKGQQSFAGELGLLPYQGKTVNEVIVSQPSDTVLEDIYVYLLSVIALTIDPPEIIISKKATLALDTQKLLTKMKQRLSQRYQLEITQSTTPIQDGLAGMHYLGILKLFDVYTDYERN